jgi:hypothetical protein
VVRFAGGSHEEQGIRHFGLFKRELGLSRVLRLRYPTAGTPFEKTRTSLRDWFYVMFLFCETRNGVAAKEVQRQLGVRTAPRGVLACFDPQWPNLTLAVA